jgi:AcrR family transcriptional regulator
MSDRSPRTARTRAALMAAGFELLVERPIDAIPIDDLVAKAGVAKGSFFNHFKDKGDFAAAISKEVRLELEALVAKANETVSDPIERIAGGMRVGFEFAIRQPKRSMALLRSMGTPTMREHPLNDGLRADIEAAASRNLLRPEAERLGVLFWLGLCQVLMQDALVGRIQLSEADQRLSDMLVMGLSGLGVPAKRAAAIANKQRVSSKSAV